MYRVGIIGTAGRKECADLWTPETFKQLCEYIPVYLRNSNQSGKQYCFVSGGAALADHAAVHHFLQGNCHRLELHLPAFFKNGQFTEGKSAGTANYYHKLFEEKTGINSLQEIQRAIDLGAIVNTYTGFWARNIQVGKVDTLMAFTFGPKTTCNLQNNIGWSNPTQAGVYPGGTAHTWKNSSATVKIHSSLLER